MKVKEIMTKKVITLNPDMSMQEVLEILVDNNISGAPVLGTDGHLAGIATEKDLLIALDFVGEKNLGSMRISEVMSKDIISFGEDADIKDIAAELARKNIKRAPIVNGQSVVGIVSRRDILKSVRAQK